MEKKFGTLQFEAQKILIGAGAVAGPYLMSVYQDRDRPEMRDRVIEVWGRLRYRECVDTLIDLLKSHDDFWKNQHLDRDWWNSGDPELRKVRQDRSGEDCKAVHALGLIGDARARQAIKHARDRWLEIGMQRNFQNVEACETALNELDRTGKQLEEH
jgi:hypothetical protein